MTRYALILLSGLLAGASGCGGGGQLPANFGDNTEQSNQAPESFEMAMTTLDLLTSFKLVSLRDTSEVSRNNPFSDDPLLSDNPNISNPKELVHRPSIELPQARDKSIFHLNNWIRKAAGGTSWKQDALVERLPAYIQTSRPVRSLAEPQFEPNDFDFIQQYRWLRDVSHWVASANDDPLTAAKIAEIESQLDEGDAQTLAEALRLFDWTMRNIRLDPFPPESDQIAAGPTAGAAAGAFRPPAVEGLPGPGYAYFPWQALLYGRGDAIQRSRVFILLARQMGIDVVMLGFEDQGPTRRHKPWVPAVHIAGRLYLFEAALGLPIPGPDGKGVASLDQLLDDSSLLRALNVDDADEKIRYPVDPRDLQNLVAMIDAEAPALSRRMQLLQDNLAGRRKMVMTVRPSKIAEQVEKCRGIKSARIWTLPFDTQFFRAALVQLARRDPQIRAMLSYEFGTFGQMTPMVTGRYMHLHGQFEVSDDDPNAAKWYLDSLVPDNKINRLDVSETIQRDLGFFNLPENPQQRAAQLRGIQEQLRDIKRHATYWLGLSQYDMGDYGGSINWLDKIVVPDVDQFAFDVRYNRARAYEAQLQIDSARRLHLLRLEPPEDETDEERQFREARRLGSVLRAKQLRDLQTSMSTAG